MIRWMSQDNDKSRVGMKDEWKTKRLKSERSFRGRKTCATIKAKEDENVSRVMTR